jgi:hypothetical protein
MRLLFQVLVECNSGFFTYFGLNLKLAKIGTTTNLLDQSQFNPLWIPNPTIFYNGDHNLILFPYRLEWAKVLYVCTLINFSALGFPVKV